MILLAADVALRMALGPLSGVEVPTGVVTTIVGALGLVVLAQRVRTPTDLAAHDHARSRAPWGRSRVSLVLLALAALLVAVTTVALLAGDTMLLLGDVANHVRGMATDRITFILDARIPRVAAAGLAGAGLALAGAIVQGVTRNPLADPGILGVSAGAGLGAIPCSPSSPTPASPRCWPAPGPSPCWPPHSSWACRPGTQSTRPDSCSSASGWRRQRVR